VQKSVSGDQRGIKKGNLESLWDAGGACKSQSPEIKGESKRGISKVYGMRGGACKSQSPEIKGESKRGISKVRLG